MVCLENDYLKVWIRPKGAELKSLHNKSTNIEHIWDANPYYWAKSSPILFPIVGSLKEDTYSYDNRRYNLSRHGFARDMVFETENKDKTKVTFLLKSNSDTLKVYPFEFELRVIYEINESNLQVQYEVKNIGLKEMPFSIGAHPAFNVPFSADSSYSQYVIHFDKEDRIERWLLDANGLLTGEKERIDLLMGNLSLSKELFHRDAIVIKGLKSNTLTLRSNQTNREIRFTFSDFPYFGIWAAKDAPFVCLEPWCGVADNQSHNQDIMKKEGINILKPQDNFVRSWSVETAS